MLAAPGPVLGTLASRERQRAGLGAQPDKAPASHPQLRCGGTSPAWARAPRAGGGAGRGSRPPTDGSLAAPRHARPFPGGGPALAAGSRQGLECKMATGVGGAGRQLPSGRCHPGPSPTRPATPRPRLRGPAWPRAPAQALVSDIFQPRGGKVPNTTGSKALELLRWKHRLGEGPAAPPPPLVHPHRGCRAVPAEGHELDVFRNGQNIPMAVQGRLQHSPTETTRLEGACCSEKTLRFEGCNLPSSPASRAAWPPSVGSKQARGAPGRATDPLGQNAITFLPFKASCVQLIASLV